MSHALTEFLERIEAPLLWTIQIEEAERQTVLLALHKLRADRPGWDYVVKELEAKLGGQFPLLAAPEQVLCLRCRRSRPAAQLLTTETGARYCLDCIKGVEICRGCGCTDEAACPGGCSWAWPGWCSTCARSTQ